MLSIHFEPGQKLYVQVYEKMRDAIVQGFFPAESQLPSYRTFADHLGVSINTVKHAYQQLMDEGYIIAKERQGFFVDKIQLNIMPQSQAALPNLLSEPSQGEGDWLYDFSPTQVDLTKLARTSLAQCAHEGMLQSQSISVPANGGERALKNEIALYLYKFRGVTTSAQNILITRGFENNLIVLDQLWDHPIYGIEDPGYPFSQMKILYDKHSIQRIPIDQYGFSVKDLERSPANIALVTPNHQFPTGIMMGIRRRQRLLKWAQEDPTRFIIEDDYDSVYKYSGHPIAALKSMDQTDQVILSGSFSKILGKFMKISYLVLPDRLLDLYHERERIKLTPSIFSQLTLARFMQEGYLDKHISRMNTYYRKKQKIVRDFLRGQEGVEVISSDAGLYLVIRLDRSLWNVDRIESLSEAHQILIHSLARYHSGKDYQDHFMIGLGGVPLDQLERGLSEWFHLLEEVKVKR